MRLARRLRYRSGVAVEAEVADQRQVRVDEAERPTDGHSGRELGHTASTSATCLARPSTRLVLSRPPMVSLALPNSGLPTATLTL